MVLIGLWHGVTWNFVLWGLWHGIGLFLHNRWSDLTKARFATLATGTQKVLNGGGRAAELPFCCARVGLLCPAGPIHFLSFLKGAVS